MKYLDILEGMDRKDMAMVRGSLSARFIIFIKEFTQSKKFTDSLKIRAGHLKVDITVTRERHLRDVTNG